MTSIKILLTHTPDVSPTKVRDVLSILKKHQGILRFSKHPKRVEFNKSPFSWNEFFEEVNHFRSSNSLPEDDFIIVLTTLKNANNWFSVFDPQGSNSVFIEANDIEWSNYIYCPTSFPIAYEVVANVLDRFMFKTVEEMNHSTIHDPAIGCLNDLCSWKPDINFKFRTADICSTCLERLENLLPDKRIISQVLSIFEDLRREMLYSKEYQKLPSGDEIFPFSIAVTKRRMSTSMEPLRKFLFLIDHFDSLIRTTVICTAHMVFPDELLKRFFQEQELNNLPSLGRWVGALKILSERESLSMDATDINQQIMDVVRIAEEDRIVYMRNTQRGHGYIDCSDRRYENEFNHFIGSINRIEEVLLRFFNKISIRQVEKTDSLGDGKFSIQYLDLSGSNPTFIQKRHVQKFSKVNDVPVSHKVHLFEKAQKKWISLHPHMIYDNCPKCRHTRFLIFDGLNYLDPFIGHSFRPYFQE